MFKFVLPILVAMFALGGPALAATHRKAVKQPQHSSKSASSESKKAKTVTSSRTAAGKTHAAKAGSSHSKSSRTASTSRRRGRSTSARRSYQQAPTLERYREIQQALAGKGYFRGEVNGQWGADSVDALRRFQREQNLNDTGKLDSVSLIALGLGPKRSLAARSTPDTTRPQDDNRRPEGSERP